VIHGLGEHIHLHVLAEAGHLQADVVDTGADHQAQRFEAGLLYQEKLADPDVVTPP